MKYLMLIIFSSIIFLNAYGQIENCDSLLKKDRFECLSKQLKLFMLETNRKIATLEQAIKVEQEQKLLEGNYNTVIHQLPSKDNIKIQSGNYFPIISQMSPAEDIASITVEKAMYTQIENKIHVTARFKINGTKRKWSPQNPYISFLMSLPVPLQKNVFERTENLIGTGSSMILDWLHGEIGLMVNAETGTSLARINGSIHMNHFKENYSNISFMYDIKE
ncbi:hypothetical protein [Silvanigrella aquatica]|uniref:Uncharacterized protein n=1 Tax=Silvanigrella aquatica TaxID=1915309 RepID=A0A1L4CX15_9BACT|nr:hypothetical protein [Silvanigrella aquatica]APJ02487.1 hypothetical protein AXG55_00470 [Silvanigrella aquatica]